MTHGRSSARVAAAALAWALAAGRTGVVGAAEGSDPFAAVAPSIARMNFSGFRSAGHCTAVQVGARAALVAGGCMKVDGFDKLHLLFGYDRQSWKAHRVGQAAFSDPTHSDLALLCLSENLPLPSLDPGFEPVSKGERVVVASYAVPAPHKVTFRGCGVAQAHDASAIVLGCGFVAGSAGGPVFKLRQDGAHLLGVAAGGNEAATLVLRWTGAAPDQLCPPEPETSVSESDG